MPRLVFDFAHPCSVNISKHHDGNFGHEYQQENDDKLWIEFQDLKCNARTTNTVEN